MVCSPHYLATGAGLRVLRQGGHAVDAAIATNAVLAVVTPYLCGIGGDLFAQVYSAEDARLSGLNGSGRAPLEATPERIQQLAGRTTMPARGPLPITVPGCVEAWAALHSKFARLSFMEILADAIHYAETGFPVSRDFARSIAAQSPVFHPDTPARETFLPRGVAPREGEVFRQPRLAATLRSISSEGPGSYYRGPIASEIARSVRAVGGLLSEEDLAGHASDWVDPLSVSYRDVTVYELPPNSQGVIALETLSILEHLDSKAIESGGEEYVHVLSEASRLAYADRDRYLTDPEAMDIDPATLKASAYTAERAGLVGPMTTGEAPAGAPGDTIYLCTADSEGNLVSLIESNFMGIGCGVMAGETGVMLQNRGAWFSLDPEHPNVVAPRKRTMHTLMPGMAYKRGKPWLVFGTMGGSMQPQIHVQLLTRLIDQGIQVDEAIDAPRFDAVVGADPYGRPRIEMEGRFSADVVAALWARGHSVGVTEPYSSAMGHAHAIQVHENGLYVGGSDPRCDGLALGY
jgi:gamma-glutamyltranspeptidase/glutathione hydrolase